MRLREERVREWEKLVRDNPRIGAIRDAMIDRLGPRSWRGPRYILLHSLAHLLINELALECGYAAASLRERIYSDDGAQGNEPMAGILIYTAAADSEGTLGGLVAMAVPETLGRVIDAARHRAELCSLIRSAQSTFRRQKTGLSMAPHATAVCFSQRRAANETIVF